MVAREEHLCLDCAQKSLWYPAPQRTSLQTDVVTASREVPVEVETLVISEVADAQVIIFREVNGARRLSFVLGIFEATTVDRALKGMASPRPLSHDAWLDTILSLGFKVEAAGVHKREEETYFAALRLVRDQEVHSVDIRPSDALLLTLKAGAPFYFTEKLLAENAVSEPEPK